MDEINLMREQERLSLFKLHDFKKWKKLKEDYKLPVKVKLRRAGKRNGFKIYFVNGYKIRQFIDFDFTQGGHGLRYLYIPLDEIWIDNSNKLEKNEIIKHEIVEFKLMRKEMDYNRAHVKASLAELHLRNERVILPVKHHKQINNWSCGPSSLKIVLDYYDDKRYVRSLIKKTGCNLSGTYHKGFRKALKRMGYDFYEKENAKITDIEEFIQKGIPIIVDYQAYHGGHFSVVIGYDKNRFLLSDPAYDKKYKWVKKSDFLKRWWEEDEPRKIIKRWMLAIYR
ncbi:MAG: C39 family peptidase [archaeon]